MLDAPLGQEQLMEIGRAFMFGSTSVLTLLVMLGAGVYLCLCVRSRRQWDGYEQRWKMPPR